MNRRDAIKLSGGLATAGILNEAIPSAAWSEEMTLFEPITDLLKGADGIAEKYGFDDPSLKPGFYQHLLMKLSFSYIQVFSTSPENPDWLPYIPFYFPWGIPNPDDIYRNALIDPKGTYRLSGNKGTPTIAKITQKMGGAHLGERSSSKTVDELGLEGIETDKVGNYSLILSAKPPESYRGLWFRLHPETTQLMYRSVIKTGSQTDATCVIERLDRPAFIPLPPTAEEISKKIKLMVEFITKQAIELELGYIKVRESRGSDKGFIFDDQLPYGGVPTQRYLIHTFTLAEDEALILESEVPETFHYWNAVLFNPYIWLIDPVYHQSSLNDTQVKLDADGKIRFIVSAKDPGVHNWLDTGGWQKGGIFWRWLEANRYPVPEVTRVKLNELDHVLPAETVRVDAAQRKALMSERIAHYQGRLR